MAKKTGLRNWPPKRFRYDVQAEKDWVPPIPKAPVLRFAPKPVETDIHLQPSWMD